MKLLIETKTHTCKTLNVHAHLAERLIEQGIQVVPMRRKDHIRRLLVTSPRSRTELRMYARDEEPKIGAH